MKFENDEEGLYEYSKDELLEMIAHLLIQMQKQRKALKAEIHSRDKEIVDLDKKFIYSQYVLNKIISQAGIPDAKEACRAIIKTAKEVLDQE